MARKSKAEATPILHQVIPALRRALSEYLSLSLEERAEFSDADVQITEALGLSLERLGDMQAAIAVYTKAIERHPRSGELFAVRGLAHYGTDISRALTDFTTAAQLGVSVIWPYLVLARHAIQSSAPGTALKLAQTAENQPGPPAARAEVYEIIGMALAELGQRREWVLENFDRAIALDPKNDRIRQNREIATALVPRSSGARVQQRRVLQIPPINPEGLREARSDQIKNRLALLNEQRQSQIGQRLVSV